MHSHYENLKVARDAPIEVIHAALRALSNKYDPRQNLLDFERAKKITRIITTSYEVLTDPVKRAEHDKWLASIERPATPNPEPSPLRRTDERIIKRIIQTKPTTASVASEPPITPAAPQPLAPMAPAKKVLPVAKNKIPQPTRSEIDEVIQSGKYSKLPPAEVVSQSDGDGPAHLSVLNQTIYTLTVTFYSSIEQSVDINAGKSLELDLVPGAYRVLCRASNPTVWPFVSNNDQYSAGMGYKWTLYVKHQVIP